MNEITAFNASGSETASEDAMPHSIEAVFYLREDCSDAISGAKCEDYGRAAHRRILERFGLTAEQLPLLRLDPWRRDGGRPFSKDEP